MQITNQAFIETLTALASSYMNDENVTWTMELFPAEDSVWKEDDFMQVMSILKGCPDVKEVEVPEYVEVIDVQGDMHGYILKINSLNNISNYCYTENLDSVPHQWLTRYQLDSVILPDEFSAKLRATLVKEEVHSNAFEIDADSWRSRLKAYNLKKTFIFEHTTSKLLYVIDVDRQVNHEQLDLKGADVTSAFKQYSFKIQMKKELHGKQMTQSSASTLILSHSLRLMQILNNEPLLVTSEQKKQVLDGYNALLTPHRFVPFGKSQQDIDTAPFFLAPKPINLEQINLLEAGKYYTIVSILNGYAVTDKADGERMLMYVDEQLDAYLINNTLDIKPTGLKASATLKNTLLDGEFISRRFLNTKSSKDVFAVFDIYFWKGASVMGLPLMVAGDGNGEQQSRYGLMKKIVDAKLWTSKNSMVELRLKEHHAGNGQAMFDNCAKLLDNPNLPYRVDGLVFTPIDLPVFTYYPSNTDIKLSSKGTRWDRVFKWKPEDLNTIDFIVREQQITSDLATNQTYKVFTLLTGYNKLQNNPIDVEEGMRLLVDKAYRMERMSSMSDTYSAEPFRPTSNYTEGVENAYLPVDEHGNVVDIEGVPIKNDTVVEFAFDPSLSDHVSKCWVALRVREDKTRIYRTTGNVSKTANDVSVANSIWRTIHNPVTQSMVKGLEPVQVSAQYEDMGENIVSSDSLYYARDVPRNHMLSFHMLNFHNSGIKMKIYSDAAKMGSSWSLLELACGKAGDMSRWTSNNLKFILGVDLVKDNIEDPKVGSFARTIHRRYEDDLWEEKKKQRRRHAPLIAFSVGDCAKPLDTGAAGVDNKSKKLLKYLYNTTNYFPSLKARPWMGIAANGFDMVSCQFAIHYFFETAQKLDNFLNNVSQNLGTGGRFIATFMDGDTVHSMLEENGKIEGKKGSKTVWAILRKYDVFDEIHAFGRVVDVYLENTNQLILEYLVKYPLLVKLAAEKGLEVVATEMFKDTFHSFDEAFQSKKPDSNNYNMTNLYQSIEALKKDPVQTKFSFVNRWVIFRKA